MAACPINRYVRYETYEKLVRNRDELSGAFSVRSGAEAKRSDVQV